MINSIQIYKILHKLKMSPRIFIVPPENILPTHDIYEENWTFHELSRTLMSTDDAIRFLAERSLLANCSICEKCHKPRSLRKFKQLKDGVVWNCLV